MFPLFASARSAGGSPKGVEGRVVLDVFAARFGPVKFSQEKCSFRLGVNPPIMFPKFSQRARSGNFRLRGFSVSGFVSGRVGVGGAAISPPKKV